jgi:hypothetical protein
VNLTESARRVVLDVFIDQNNIRHFAILRHCSLQLI